MNDLTSVRRPVSLWALLASALLGAAQAATVYRGTLGSQAIVLRLGDAGDSRYFYARIGVDIPLTGDARGNTFTLTESPAGDGSGLGGDSTAVTGRLTLTRGGGALSGTWRSPDGTRRLAVRLRTVDAAAEPLALSPSLLLLKWRAQDAATFLKFNRPLLAAGRQGGLMWLREPLSGLRFPRLPGSAPGNAALQDRQLADAQSALDCRGQLGAGQDPGQPAWSETSEITYRSARLLSVASRVEYFCGGAHPDAYVEGLTLDTRSGRALSVRELWPGLSFAEQNRRYLAAYPRGQDSADCRETVRDNNPDYVNSHQAFAAYLTPNGLSLWPNTLPYAVQNCAETVTLPYRTLAPLAGPLAPRR